MMLQNGIRTLARLGLTPNQAKIYLTLATIGIANARTISQKSGIARPEVYIIMRTLEKIGLVEKAITSPAMFKATPISDAASILLNQRKQATAELHTELKKLTTSLKHNNSAKASEQDAPEFILIPNKEANLRKRSILINKTLGNIELLSSSNRLQTMPHPIFEDTLAALRRGVKIRVVTEKPKDEALVTATLKRCLETGKFEIRYILDHPSILLAIFDNKAALITTKATTDAAESSELWTNNLCIVKALEDYFEVFWLTSIKHDNSVLANINA